MDNNNTKDGIYPLEFHQSEPIPARPIQPYEIGTGVLRGTQTYLFGNTKLEIGQNIKDRTTGFMVYDNAPNRRMLFGQYPDGTVKMKLSKPGFDADKASDDQLIWSSDFNGFKIVNKIQITVAIPSAGSSNTAAIAHNLAKIPAYVAYWNNGASYYNLPFNFIDLATGNSYAFIGASQNKFAFSNSRYLIYNGGQYFGGIYINESVPALNFGNTATLYWNGTYYAFSSMIGSIGAY